MNTHRLALVSIIVGLALPAPAALLFTNINTGTGVSSSLTALAYDSNSTFLAVSASATTLAATYNTNSEKLEWSKSSVSGTVSLTYGAGKFVAGGPNNSVFTSINKGTNWAQATSPFPNAATVDALGFNNGRFIAAGSIVEIFYAGTALNPWASASLTSASYLESYTGMTPFGANGFAVCGILDTVRVSSDGVTWTVSPGRPLNINNPDLYGIAAGSGQTLVAVGAGGRIVRSADGGYSWTAPSSPVGNNLNAVGFSSDTTYGGFIAAGDGGRILTSPDGNIWANQTSPTVNNLHGVAFANSGNLQGVGILVGDNGTVVLAGTPPMPPVPTNTFGNSSQTNCSFSLPNPPLTVTVVPDAAHPTNTVGVDWYDATGTLVTNNSTSFYPLDFNAPFNAPTTNTYYAVARDLRTGFTSTNVPTNGTPVTLTLYPRPTAMVSGTNTICTGQSITIQAMLTGVAPWTVTWASNGIPFVTIMNVMNPTNILPVSPVNPGPNVATNVFYTVTDLSDYYSCHAFASNLTGVAQITVNATSAPPTSATAAQATICNGQSTTLTLNGGGGGNNETIQWYTGSCGGTAVATGQGAPVSPTVTTIYYGRYEDGAPCNFNSACAQVTVTVNQKSADPTSATAGASTICNGQSTTLTLNGGGGGTGEIIRWYTGSCGGTVAATGQGATVSPTVTTIYYGRYEDGAPCNYNSACAQVTVTVNQKSADPTSATAGASTICNGQSTTLTLNGGGGGTGEIIRWYTGSCGGTVAATGQGATVSPTVTTIYYGRYEDGAPCNFNSACVQVTVTVNQKSADPTSATVGASTICNGQSTTLTLNGGGGGTGEIIRWYTGSCGGTVAATGQGATVSPTVTTIYYGRYEDGAPCNFNSACVQVTVTVNQKSADPTSATAGASTICNGQSTTLTLNGGGGGTGEIIRWYTGSCGGTVAATGQGATVSPTVTTIYYGRYEDGAPCNYLSACQAVTVTIIPQPEIKSISISNGDVTLVWTSLSGVNYQVQYTTDLTQPVTWTALPSGPFTGNPTATATDISGLGALRFYQVSVMCP